MLPSGGQLGTLKDAAWMLITWTGIGFFTGLILGIMVAIRVIRRQLTTPDQHTPSSLLGSNEPDK
jgi:hypothetical protein